MRVGPEATATLGATTDPSTSAPAEALDDHRLALSLAATAGRALVELRDADDTAARLDPWWLRDEADRRAHDLLVEQLGHHRPHDVVMSEEGADDRRRLEADRTWIVDPLDGTHDYPFKDSIEWAVHVALVEAGRPTAAAVAVPGLGWVFGTEIEGHGDRGDRTEPLVICGRSNIYHASAVAELLGGVVTACGSSGVKAMLVVDGAVDVYVHASGLYEWDVCAPAAVAESAGLVVTDIHGRRIEYNKARPVVEGLVVVRPEYAVATRAALDQLG